MSTPAVPIPLQPEDLQERLLAPEPQNVTVDAENREEELARGGEKQESACRDGFFALLFYIHLAAIITLSVLWGFPNIHYSSNIDTTNSTLTGAQLPVSSSSMTGVLYLILCLGVGSLVVSMTVLGVMANFASALIQISILFNIFASILAMVLFASADDMGAAFGAFVVFALFACYAWSVWHRIPFAAANLSTAVTAVRTNIGVAFIPVITSVLLCGYLIAWFFAMYGTYLQLYDPNCDPNYESCSSVAAKSIVVVYVLFLVWTIQIVTNVIHVTVAGVVGTWWFAPEAADSCCSPSILDSYARAMLTSFGSICFGSLLVGLVNIMHQLVHSTRRNTPRHTNSLLVCIVDCILSLIEKLVKVFNKWAFVYVGLYGYPYLEAGKKVLELFGTRGWTMIINDKLVGHVLAWMSLVIGGCTGACGVILAGAFPSVFDVGGSTTLSGWIGFSIGLALGGGIASILMNQVSSAVDTVVVCFAEAPGNFLENYPELHNTMEEAWMATYPTEYSREREEEEQQQQPEISQV